MQSEERSDGGGGVIDVYGDSRPDPEWDDAANGIVVGEDEMNDLEDEEATGEPGKRPPQP